MRVRSFGPKGPGVPVIGQGTWNVPLHGAAAQHAIDALRRGIELGLTHIDTAEMYGAGAAEELIARAISGVPRERLFLVSKVLPENASYQGTIDACERTLQRLGIDELDCYLLHWPSSNHPLEETMRALADLRRDGKTRAIGVSNFDVEDVQEALAYLDGVPLACNQVLYNLEHRGIERRLIPFCREHDIAVVGYTPFGRRPLRGDALDAAAHAHGVGVHAVALAFLTRLDGTFAIPKASDVAHVESNASAGDLVLTPDEIAAIDAAHPVGPDGPLATA